MWERTRPPFTVEVEKIYYSSVAPPEQAETGGGGGGGGGGETKRKKKKNLSLEYFLSVKLFAGIQRQNRRIYQKNMCYNKYRKIIACSFQK